MAYLPRNFIIWDGAFFHVTWQCHNKDFLLQYPWAKQAYYDLLVKYKNRYRVSFYSYHFMDNHIHLSGKIEGAREDFSALFRIVNSLLARLVNKRLKRRGQVIMDRFKSPIIQDHNALLNVMHYHDLNSFRAGMVKHPKDYRWSSYAYYAEGKADLLITPSPCYLEMGGTDKKRQTEYKERVDTILQEEGNKKKAYSHSLYIGDPDWVRKRYDQVKQIRFMKRQAYLKRQSRFYQELSAGP